MQRLNFRKIQGAIMRPNKLFFDLYSTCGNNMTREQYKAYYAKHNIVYVVLADAKIYTKVEREKMFDLNMHHGCFIEHYPQETPQEVERQAMQVINDIKARFVEPKEFVRIEQEKDQERTLKAFRIAEKMIAER